MGHLNDLWRFYSPSNNQLPAIFATAEELQEEACPDPRRYSRTGIFYVRS